MAITTSSTLIGSRIKRREDLRLLQGQGSYTGDLQLLDMLHVAFARSPHAHARVIRRDLDAARALPGIVAVFGPDDLPILGRPMPPTMGETPGLEARFPAPLADVVRFTGEAVALVVADDPYRAADGAAAVRVEYDKLAVALDPLDRDGPRVHADIAGNVAGEITRAIASNS